MKQVLAIILTAVLLFSMAACGGSSDTPVAPSTDTPSSPGTSDNNGSDAIQVDEGLLKVDVTLPASFFTDQAEEEIIAEANEQGYNHCVINSDGSVTYTMTKAKHKEVLEEYKTSIDELIAGFLEGEDAVASFVNIEYNSNFSQIDIRVDPDAYSMWDNLYALSLYLVGAYYQSFAGTPADEIDVVVNFIDNVTGEVLNTGSYKEFADNSSDSSDEISEEIAEETSPVVNATTLALQENVVIEDECEFYVDYTDITDDVMPPQPGSWYSHYEAENNKVYIDICVAYKNLATKEVSADEVMNAKLIYGGKYTYTGFSMIEEDNRGDFTYSSITNIAPLSTEYLHYLFEVPADLESSEGALTVILNIGGNTYSVVVREGIEGEVASLSADAVAKTSGSVKNGEIIAVMNTCEFYVDYSNITDDVMPPQPGNWYSHYEAADGKVYVDFCVAYKNFKTSDVSADEVISAKLTYAGKYEYTGFSMIEEDSRGDFTYSSITGIAPLSIEYLHYLFEVPAEVASSSETVEISFTIGGNTYSYTVR